MLTRREDLIVIAKENVCSGVIEEPRGFRPDSNGAFRNNERYPVRVTHMTLDPTTGGSFSLSMFDQFFMSKSLLMPVASWANTVVGASDVITRGTSAWQFARPFVLSARDSLEVRVALNTAPESGTSRQVKVTFTGLGLRSQRPYFFTGTSNLTNLDESTMDPESYRPDGTEPVVITDMTVVCGALRSGSDVDSETQNDQGDITLVDVNVRQIGNGTNLFWFSGASSSILCPAKLLGVTSGVSVVYKFPGDGLIWEPGEGLEGVVPSGNELPDMGFFGYISIT